MARPSDFNPRLLLAHAILCLVLCGATIGTQSLAQQSTDGPVSVNLGNVFRNGSVKIEDADLTSLPLLPQGYAALNNKAYRITTDGEAVGPYKITFKVSSITDEEIFRHLRIFHAEPDKFDPDSLLWIDRTAIPPNAPTHDFKQKTIHAYSDELDPGFYLIGRLVEQISPSTAVADLEVVAKGVPESVQMPSNITILVTIKNNGPQVANDVGVLEQLASVSGTFVSAKPSQGTCKHRQGRLYCKLGQLAVGSVATIEVVLEPSDDFAGQYRSFVEVAAREPDSNGDNNRDFAFVLAHPDPNAPPDIELNSPAMDQLFEQGATVVLNAKANDSDGSVTRVEFFDYEKSLGIGSTSDARNFSVTSNAFSNGRHVLGAVATDNGGRSKRSNTKHIFVNGPMKVRILEPKAETLITPGSHLTLTAEAIHPSGSIRSLEFFTVGISLGKATLIDGNRFTLKVRDVKRAKYSIEAIATDESGLISKSPRLELKVSNKPTVRIATPTEGTSLMTPVDIELILSRESPEYGRRVEVYANGALIEQGSVLLSGKYAFTWKDVPAGKYELKAVVIDVIGVRGESSPVNIIIKDRNR